MNDSSKELLSILDAHGSRLHALLTRLTLREDVAEDLMQELFLKLSRSGGFRRAIDPSAYAFRSAINIAFDWRRNQSKLIREEPFAAEPSVNSISPTNELIRSEEINRVLRTLEKLSERSRDIVVMRYIHCDSYERIAEAFNKTPQQIRGLCHKAVTRLREMLNGKPSSQRSGGVNREES